jgi:hypothetical protein
MLFFPGGMSAALELVAIFGRESLIGASSISDDPAQAHYDKWVFLPYIFEDSFAEDFRAVVKKEGVDIVYTPHMGVWRVLKNLIENEKWAVQLLGADPARRERDTIASVFTSVDSMPLNKEFGDGISRLEYAALLWQASTILGEMDGSKIGALASTAPSWPKGDVVEIGSLCGKATYVLSWLAERFSVGNVLSIDPWTRYTQEEAGGIAEDIAAERDLDMIHDAYLMMALGVGRGNINFIRLESGKAIGAYEKGVVRSVELGEISYAGKISLLHIDGNHDYPYVKQDIADWSPKVVDGGWLVIDDYDWVFGDGPHRAANEFVADNLARIQRQFVAGGALFLRLKSQDCSTR